MTSAETDRRWYDRATMQRTAPPADYDSDFALWAAAQVAALRERRFDDLDLANLIEEIDSLSRSDRNQLQSRLTKLAFHLLKLQHQPERASGSWLRTIVEQSARIRRLLKNSPSLRPALPELIAEAYADARPAASAETRLPIADFPETPTPNFARAVDAALAGEDFGGDAAVSRAARIFPFWKRKPR
jgi:hypothetical protein